MSNQKRENTSKLDEIIITLTNFPQYHPLLLDVITKVCSGQPRFVVELAKFIRKEVCWLGPKVILVNRGGRKSRESIASIDISKIKLVRMLKDNEKSIYGEERLRRLKESNYFCLDLKVLKALLKNKHLIPKSWKGYVGGKCHCITFDGTVVHSCGRNYVPYLYYGFTGKWLIGWRSLDDWFNNSRLSAVLESD